MTDSTIAETETDLTPESEDLNTGETGGMVSRLESSFEADSSVESVGVSKGMLYNVWIPLVVLAAAIAVFQLLGVVQAPQRPPDDLTMVGRLRALSPVEVTPLKTLEEIGKTLYLEVDGTVVPYREAKVAAEIAGRIVFKSDECEAGSYVNSGQLLMRIDPTDYELEVERLTRLCKQEYQAIQELDQDMANVRRLIEVAKQDVQLQQGEVERQTSLPKGFTSQAEVDQAQRGLLAATQQLVTFENQLQLQQKTRIRLESSEQLAVTQLRAAEINLARTEIRAPIDGVIVSEDADLNTFVARGSGLLTIDDTSKVEVATNLRMDQLYWILNQQGDVLEAPSRSYDLPETPAIIEYEIAGRDDSTYRWHGRLLSYDGIGLDPVTRTVPVRVVVDDPTALLDASGKQVHGVNSTPLVRSMFVRVKLEIQPRASLVVVPSRALHPGNQIFLFVPDQSVLDLTPEQSELIKKQAAATQRSTETENQASAFQPRDWVAGKVTVRRSVFPINALTIEQPDVASGVDTTQELPERDWVCEVNGPKLQADASVVTSPIGVFSDTYFPARVNRTQLERSPSRRDRQEKHRAPLVANEEDS